MEQINEALLRTEEREFVITRTFDAPRDLVWKAWTERERLEQWWGPKGFKIEVHSFDLRPGGVFHYSMNAANGYVMWGKFVYREIAAPERLVFVSAFSDAEGNITTNPFKLKLALETLNVVTLEEVDGKTLLTLKGGPINATEEELATYFGMRSSMEQGFAGTFEQLDEVLVTMV